MKHQEWRRIIFLTFLIPAAMLTAGLNAPVPGSSSDDNNDSNIIEKVRKNRLVRHCLRNIDPSPIQQLDFSVVETGTCSLGSSSSSSSDDDEAISRTVFISLGPACPDPPFCPQFPTILIAEVELCGNKVVDVTCLRPLGVPIPD